MTTPAEPLAAVGLSADVNQLGDVRLNLHDDKDVIVAQVTLDIGAFAAVMNRIRAKLKEFAGPDLAAIEPGGHA